MSCFPFWPQGFQWKAQTVGVQKTSDATEDFRCCTVTIICSITTSLCWAILLLHTTSKSFVYVAIGALTFHLLIVSPWVVKLHAESTIYKSRNRTKTQVCAEFFALLNPWLFSVISPKFVGTLIMREGAISTPSQLRTGARGPRSLWGCLVGLVLTLLAKVQENKPGHWGIRLSKTDSTCFCTLNPSPAFSTCSV